MMLNISWVIQLISHICSTSLQLNLLEIFFRRERAMRRLSYSGLAALLIVAMATGAFSGVSRLNLKVGEEIYACNPGAGCPYQTLSLDSGKCNCGSDLVKARVVKVERDVAYLQAPGWEKPRPFKTVGKYACACGRKCKCTVISQKLGKCPCGKEMRPVKQ